MITLKLIIRFSFCYYFIIPTMTKYSLAWGLKRSRKLFGFEIKSGKLNLWFQSSWTIAFSAQVLSLLNIHSTKPPNIQGFNSLTVTSAVQLAKYNLLGNGWKSMVFGFGNSENIYGKTWTRKKTLLFFMLTKYNWRERK